MTQGEHRGLTSEEARKLASDGYGNGAQKSQTRGVGRIIFDNSFTLFNAMNMTLAALGILAGSLGEDRGISFGNMLFLGVVFSASLIRIAQEVRAKITVDRLAILTQAKARVLRDGVMTELAIDELVLSDVIEISSGSQISADGVVLESAGLEVDESLLTGESHAIAKHAGAEALSGSFAISGRGLIQLTRVGGTTYANCLTREVKREKYTKSLLMASLHKMLRLLTFIIVPVGALLFLSDYLRGAAAVDAALLGAAAAMVGMIPQGLVLLIEIAFMVGVINLGKRKMLVQSLPSIETLARVDVLCLDKTGTITDGNLTVAEVITLNGDAPDEVGGILGALVAATGDQNETARAIQARFPQIAKHEIANFLPFSSARKYSGVTFKELGSYILGAPELLVLNEEHSAIAAKHAEAGQRVLALARTDSALTDSLPDSPTPVALIALDDNIRPEAPAVFAQFLSQGVTLKIISGDNPATIRSVAARAGIPNLGKWIDMSAPTIAPIAELAEEYAIFCRTSPEQKRELIRALRQNGHTVAMTGDGVNDVLAMYEADASIAMANGSDATRAIADLALLNSDFSSLVPAVYEGRRVVNNIERVGALFLNKTLYSSLLAMLFIFLPLPYPFIPIQLTFLSALTIGIPSFFLALKPNEKRIEGDFLRKVLLACAPTACAIVLCILAIELAGGFMNLNHQEISTLCSILTGALGISLVIRSAHPMDARRGLMIGLIVAAFVAGLIFSSFLGAFNILQYANILNRLAFVYLPLIPAGLLIDRAFRAILRRRMR